MARGMAIPFDVVAAPTVEIEPSPACAERVGTEARSSLERETMSRCMRLVRDYDVGSIQKQVARLRRMQSRETDMAQLRREDEQRTQMLKRQITGMAFRGGISADEVAMVAGLIVGAAVVGGFGFGMPSRQMKSKQRAARVDGLCERAHARVDRGECFLPAVGRVLPSATVDALNDWFCNAAEPRLRGFMHETLAREHVPLSLETVGSQGLAFELDALRQLLDDKHPVSYVTVMRQYHERMDALVELAQADGMSERHIQAAMGAQALKLMGEDGTIDFGPELAAVIGHPTPAMLQKAERLVANATGVEPFASGAPISEVPSALREMLRIERDEEPAHEDVREHEGVDAEAKTEASAEPGYADEPEAPRPVEVEFTESVADAHEGVDETPDYEAGDQDGFVGEAETVDVWQSVRGADGALWLLDRRDEHGWWQSDRGSLPDDGAVLRHVDAEMWERIPEVAHDTDHIMPAAGGTRFICTDGRDFVLPITMPQGITHTACDVSGPHGWSSDQPGFVEGTFAFCAKNGIAFRPHMTVGMYEAGRDAHLLAGQGAMTQPSFDEGFGL